MNELPTFILVHSPLVGPSSLLPTARFLEREGFCCHLPTPEGLPRMLPAWRDWPELLLDSLPEVHDVVVVGHSAGGLLAAWLAGRLNARGMICLDAAIPPEAGSTPPVEPGFREFVHSLPREGELLPPWSEWWGTDVVENASLDPTVKTAFVAELPRIPIGWFDDTFDMLDWSRCRRGFLRTSSVLDSHADDAESRGWPVIRIEGTHLHPTIEPEETGTALREICRSFSD